ncbi:hypothetical protein HPB48_011188 [Haemaphysalis longicornis]|uniref:Uncharacterized protein n=1 Tax=Haemaphysalis longicornis TaxID=44386 RepID=A0A9J6GX54_HAELO|nr:hypothetical protein HPB48_011188 [Haemaphysalis longicornis]
MFGTVRNEDEFPQLGKDECEDEPRKPFANEEEETFKAELQRKVKEVDARILSSLIKRTFADVTRSSEAKRHSDPDPEEGEGWKQSVLHIKLKDTGEKDAAKVAEAELKKNFEPSQFGLNKVTLRKTRQGVLVLADEKEGLDRLKSELDTHEVLKRKLAAEFPRGKHPEICIFGVPNETQEAEIQKELAKQTNTEEEQIIIKRKIQSKRRSEVTNSSSPRSSIAKIYGARTCEDWMDNVQGKRKPVYPEGVRKWEKKDKEQIGISLYRRVGHHPQNFDQVRGHQDDKGGAVDLWLFLLEVEVSFAVAQLEAVNTAQGTTMLKFEHAQQCPETLGITGKKEKK